jgi:hypothetical protein
VFDGRLAVSGAQPAEVLGEVARRAWDERVPQVVTIGDGSDADACGPDGCELPGASGA